MAHLDSVDDPRFAALLAELETRPHARSALVGAAFDLLARSHEVSIASLLEAPTRPGSLAAEPEAPRSVLVNGLISERSPEAVATAAAELALQGMSAVKLEGRRRRPAHRPGKSGGSASSNWRRDRIAT